jgi:hypothetical protein
MRFHLPVLLLALVAACATPEQRAARVEQEVTAMIQEYGPGCERLGYKATRTRGGTAFCGSPPRTRSSAARS